MKILLATLLAFVSISAFSKECSFSVKEPNLFPKSIAALESLGFVQDSAENSSLSLVYNSQVMIYGGLLDDNDLRVAACFGRVVGDEINCLIKRADSYRWGPIPLKDEAHTRRIERVVKTLDRRVAKRIEKTIQHCSNQ